MSSKKTQKAFENFHFLHSREARTIRILSEYIEPEKRLQEQNILHTIVFFGSARVHPDMEDAKQASYYNAAEEFAYRLAQFNKELRYKTGNSYYICTGGGPGIMEAANKGAARAGEPTVGFNIELPFEQSPNEYISPELNFEFHYFFMRKLWFLYQAKAIIIFPGGFGTMDEMFETLTLVQTKKLEKFNFPILLYDPEFWKNVINFDRLAQMGLISEDDLKHFTFFSSPQEGLDILIPQLQNIMENINHLLDVKFPI
jgi:uncharacterized protein (TIGR00730 family)